MFFTEVKNQKTRPNTSASLVKPCSSAGSDSWNQIKQIKRQVREVKQQYHNSLKNVKSLCRSIQKTNIEAQLKRIAFIKKYEKKKLKLEQSKLLESKKISEQKRQEVYCRKAKEQKLYEQLQTAITILDVENRRNKERKYNRSEKQKLRSRIISQKQDQMSEAKRRYELTKQNERNLKSKKQAIKDLVMFQAKHNYMKKIENQVMFITNYDNLISQLETQDMSRVRCNKYQQEPTGIELFLTSKQNGYL